MIDPSQLYFSQGYLLFLGILVVAAFLFKNKADLKDNRANTSSLILRSGCILMLFFVMAGPYIVEEKDVRSKHTKISLIFDKSASMEIFGVLNPDDVLGRQGAIEGISSVSTATNREYNESRIGDLIYSEIAGSTERGSAVVLFSDGRQTGGRDILDVTSFGANVGAKIFPIIPNTASQELYIKDIEGAKQSPKNTLYAFDVVVGTEGEDKRYGLEVLIDDEIVFDSPIAQGKKEHKIGISHIFEEEGIHRVIARIVNVSGGQDHFEDNNIFYKTVAVTRKPKILFVGNITSPLGRIVSELYDIDARSRMPSAISGYDAIILNDVASKDIESGGLGPYLEEGRGLVVFGGKNSYGYGGYSNSPFEGLLPVYSKKTEPRQSESLSVIILLDISGSTGVDLSGQTKIDVEKAIALAIIDDVGEHANIAAVAFNSAAYTIQNLGGGDKNLLKDKISRLRFGGGTYVLQGLEKSGDMLEGIEGAKHIVLISDGRTNYPVSAFEKASELGAEGISIHAVGVGFDTDTEFMRGIARNGGGIYFSPEESNRLKVILGDNPPSEEDEGDKYSAIVINPHHFITEDASEIVVGLLEINEVSKKRSAQVLMASQDMHPILTVWRFGLGRVVAVSTDDGSRWAAELYGHDKSKIVSSAINWAVGDASSKEDDTLECEDGRIGENIDIRLTVADSGRVPEIGGDDNLEITSIAGQHYLLTFVPAKKGFERIEIGDMSCDVAINSPREYLDLGVDYDVLETIAEISSAKTYMPEDIAGLRRELEEYSIAESRGMTRERVDLFWVFGIFAVLLFFSDVSIRRIAEIMSRRQA